MQVIKKSGRRRQQWLLLWIMVLTVGLGWKYPLMGFAVPLVIITGLTISFYRGRYLCGNLCPRGSFVDKVMVLVSPGRDIPTYIRNMGFRWAVVVGLIGFMFYRGFQDPLNPYHWGNVFWMLCAVTTGVAIVLGFFIHQRTWCSFCPIGTLQNIIGGTREHLQINSDLCRECRLCEDVCAINLGIINHKDNGEMTNRDCLKCSKCIDVCPASALSWPTE